MGSNLPAPSQTTFLTQIAENYVQIGRINQGIVLGKKDEQHTFILKEFSFVNQEQFKQKFSTLEEQLKRGPRDYLTNIVRVESQIFNNFCSTSFKVYAIFEYPQVSLKEQILARSKQGKCFEQGQLWSILQSCTNALSELKPSISLVPSEIFINAEGNLKIIHNDLIDENYRSVPTAGVYYAPQKLKQFYRIDSELTLRKQSIFSMGMTILQAALLEDLLSCYDILKMAFSEVELMDKIESIYNRYSPQFNEVLSNILQVNPNRRASLMEVQKILDSYWASQNCEERVSTDLRESSRSNHQLRLNQVKEDISNKAVLSQQNENIPLKHSLSKSQRPKQRDLTLPDELSSYKLQKPINDPIRDSLITPKNPPTSKQAKGIYTDPRLLQMIKKDLEDISRLKQSAFYETGKYTSNYSQMTGANLPVLTGPYYQAPIIQQEIINNSDQQFQTARDYHEDKVGFISEKDYSSARIDERQILMPSIQNHQRQSSAQPSHMMKKNNQGGKIFIVESYQNGSRYEGMSLLGKKHGKGRLIFEDGVYYEGDFKDDRMTGKGVLYYREGQPAYDGEWLNDHFHGQGILFNQSPDPLEEPFDFRDFNNLEDFWIKYEGGFDQDNKHGEGKLLLTNGEIFEGEFVNDLVQGHGSFSNMEGMIVIGTWENNALKSIN